MHHDLIYCPQQLLDTMPRVTFARGDRLVRVGETARVVYVVLEGVANVVYPTNKGREIIASHFLPGDFIGELNAICGQPYLFDAVAITPMRLLKVEAERFIACMRQDFRLVQSMVQSQYNRISFLESYSLVGRSFSIYERMLLFFDGSYNDPRFRDNLDKDFLVMYIGTDIRCVNRVLEQMTNEGLLRVVQGRIEAVDRDAVRRELRAHQIDYYADIFHEYFVEDGCLQTPEG